MFKVVRYVNANARKVSDCRKYFVGEVMILLYIDFWTALMLQNWDWSISLRKLHQTK